jgi:hypothetical protein
LHNFISAVFMSCIWMNGMLFCAEPASSRIYVSLPKDRVESLESQDYRYVPDIRVDTVADVIMSSDVLPEKHDGCKLTTSSGKDYYFADNCVNFKKQLKKLEDK